MKQGKQHIQREIKAFHVKTNSIKEAFGIVFRRFKSFKKTFHRPEFPKLLFPYLKLILIIIYMLREAFSLQNAL